MTYRFSSTLLATLLGLGSSLAFTTGHALETWTFDNDSCIANVGGTCTGGTGVSSNAPSTEIGNWSQQRTYESDGTTNVVVTGWANTGPNAEFEQGRVTHFGGGLGVGNAEGFRASNLDPGENDAGGSNHAFDNDTFTDFALFDFGAGKLVTLTGLDLTFFGDQDIAILAYNPVGGTPDLTNSSLEQAAQNGPPAAESLTSAGWNVIAGIDEAHNGGALDNFNTTAFSSRYWLIGAYTNAFPDPDGQCCDLDDKFKLAAMSGTVSTPVPPSSTAPEPATLLLLAAGAPLLRLRKRG